MYQYVLEKGAAGMQKDLRIVQFDSVNDFVRDKNDPRCTSILNDSVLSYFTMQASALPEEWFGAATQAEVEKILKVGDSKFVDLVREQKVEVSPPESIKRRKQLGDWGDEVDIHKLYAGNLDTAWRRRSPRPRVGARNIRLLVNIIQNCNTNADQLRWIGVAALALAEAFESAGYNLAIDAVGGAADITPGEHIAFLIPIKEYGEPVDIQGLSSVVCFPGFMRWPGFMNLGLSRGGAIDPGLGRAFVDGTISKYVIPLYYRDASEAIELVSNATLSKADAEKEVARIMAKYVRGEDNKMAA